MIVVCGNRSSIAPTLMIGNNCSGLRRRQLKSLRCYENKLLKWDLPMATAKNTSISQLMNLLPTLDEQTFSPCEKKTTRKQFDITLPPTWRSVTRRRLIIQSLSSQGWMRIRDSKFGMLFENEWTGARLWIRY